jgi:hypothetical protein
MKRQRPRMFLPKIHPPKFARNGETCDAKVAYPRFSRSPIFAPFRADPKCDPERRARAGWHVRAAGEPWQTHPLYKKFTVSRDVTGAPATARSKVNKRGSMLKLGLEIHREKFVVVLSRAGYAAPAAAFCSQGICPLGRSADAGRLSGPCCL